MQADFGFLIKQWPAAIGSDVAGEVIEVGANVKRFQKGDRAVGHAWSFKTGKPEDAAFNLYTRLPAANSAVIPSKIAYKEAAVLPMAIDTVSCGLNAEGYFGLPFPTTDPKPSGRVLIVYGGSSSVGSMAIQIGTAMGFRVIAIAGAKNFDLCRRCGASDVFDYKDSKVVDDVVKAVGKDEFLVYNAIGEPPSYEVLRPVLEKLGGGKVASTKEAPEGLPKNVEVQFVFGIGEFSWPLWENFVTKALESGQLKCLPEPVVVGKGLESIQMGMERVKAGVSAQKVVVEI